MNIKELEQNLKTLLLKMSCQVHGITVLEEGEGLIFSIETPQAEYLIGPHGETLASVTHIFRKIAEKKGEGIPVKMISLDVNNYRRRRAETLQGIAKMLAERARTFRHDVEMDPLPPYDRLIIHSFFENHPWITTESRGEGKSRHVVLKYFEKEEAPTEKF